MRKNGIIRKIINAIKDPEREFVQRVFLALTIVSEFTVFTALIGDILIDENPYEIVTIIVMLIFVPILMIVSLYREKLKLAIKITVIALVFFIVPALYIFGGGVEGGGVLWIIFTFTYAGLVLTGTWRVVIFILIFIISLICYLIEYYFPNLIYVHSRKSFMIDSFLSIILVGIICFAMTWLQNWIFMGENMRAKKAVEKAEELSRSQNRFFSSMSHEIRTPINSILGLNELILRDQSASDEIVKNASGIQGSGKMLLALINDILDFSKMEAGSMDIIPVEYKIGDLLSEIVNMMWFKAQDKDLKLNVSVDPNVPRALYGDEVRIKQIIVNLLNNAVKYTLVGSVELHVESEEKDEKTVELLVSVSDTGIGIKKEVIPYLFDAFKRVDEEQNRHIEGTGLGLSIVKQLVNLMGGNITVNSVYGEGSTFTVVLTQGIADRKQIGELSIHNQGFINRSRYESSFRAPDARILIVDDNEMNLEVERKLLAKTDMMIGKALSGKEALELDLKYHYDVILMDHLMPEMDGIECLRNIRNHTGGLNRTTPVIVLTANAGSDNRELYRRSGFDGYLVKPVSGEALENMLIKYIPDEKLLLNSNKVMSMREDINASFGYSGKTQIVVTSTSMCDLPDSLIKKLHIPILPFLIKTEEGVFKDGVQMGEDELIRYMRTGRNAVSLPPDEKAYTEFFASELKKAHHIIHIAITSSMSDDYERASEAAKSFDNVTVINSQCLSSSAGILVLIAHKLTQMSDSVEEIVKELEIVKERLSCSFIIDTTEYMARKGYISANVDRFARNLNLHPCVRIKDDKSRIGGIWIGNKKRVYKKYIAKAFPVDVIPDPEVVFITYADVPIDTLLWIEEEISKIAYFENVIFKQASAAISANCGPGSFGILYFVKSNKSYNLSGLFDDELTKMEFDEIEEDDKEKEAATEETAEPADSGSEAKEKATEWYDGLDGIDGAAGVKASGSENAYKDVLKMFYESIGTKAEELKKYYAEEDWKNYTIKVHALKSSCKLIGALSTSEKAQLLEDAGKEENTECIRAHHEEFIGEYTKYREVLSTVFAEASEDSESDENKPEADEALLTSVYEQLREAANSLDCDEVEAALKRLKDYSIPDNEAGKFNTIREKAEQFDYDGILEVLDD